MPTRPPDLDIVAVVVVIAGALFAPEVAAIAGPYAVIIGAALGGALWSASGRSLGGRWRAAGYVLGMTLLGVLVAVPASELLAHAISGVQARWLFGLVALAVGARGADLLLSALDAAVRVLGRTLRLHPGAVLRWLLRLFPDREGDPK